MRKFMKDYGKLCKDNGVFYKEHWKGVIVMNAVILGAELAYLGRHQIKNTLKEKFNKEEA